MTLDDERGDTSAKAAQLGSDSNRKRANLVATIREDGRALSEGVYCAIPGECQLGEGPHWSEANERLYWVDILAPAFASGDPQTGEQTRIVLPELIGAAVPKRSGGFIAATEHGIRSMNSEGALTTLANPEFDMPGNRFNDAKCDRQGRLWAGSLALDGSPGHGALWSFSPEGRVSKEISGVHIANGLGWSPDDRRFYFTDSGRQEIREYDFDLASGSLEKPRVFAAVDPLAGTPDGLAVDAEGYVWSAYWDGWSVTRFDPDGRIDRVVTLPVPRPTSCAFGGLNRKTLYVTTARIGLSSQQIREAPLSGSVFAIDTGVRGQAEANFGG